MNENVYAASATRRNSIYIKPIMSQINYFCDIKLYHVKYVNGRHFTMARPIDYSFFSDIINNECSILSNSILRRLVYQIF